MISNKDQQEDGHHDTQLHGSNRYHGNSRYHGNRSRSIQGVLSDRRYVMTGRSQLADFFYRHDVMKTLRPCSEIKIEYDDRQNCVRWSSDGSTLLSCGVFVSLFSYPDKKPLFRVATREYVYGADFLSRDKIAIGTSNGKVAVLPLENPPDVVTDDVELRSWPGANIIHCNKQPILSVKPVPGLSENLFYTTTDRGTVRLHDARSLCARCRGENNINACTDRVVVDGGGSINEALSVNPVNPYQFCLAHNYTIGIYDLRKCGSNHSYNKNNYLESYEVSELRDCQGRGMVTHTVYSDDGSEILVNTRAGLLLLRRHEMVSEHRDTVFRPRDTTTYSNRDNTGKETIMVCDDHAGFAQNPLVPSHGAAGHLGNMLNEWLSTREGRRVPQGNEGVRGNSEGSGRGSGDAIVARYIGHRNTLTSLKEALILSDKYILSGSDCGRLFMWDKHTGELMMAIPPDTPPRGPIVSVQAHPVYPGVIATCGSVGSVRVWEPSIRGEVQSSDELERIKSENEKRLRDERKIIKIPNSVIMEAINLTRQEQIELVGRRTSRRLGLR